MYDGMLGEDDEEVPRVLLEFLVNEITAPQKTVQIQNVGVLETAAKRQLSSPKGQTRGSIKKPSSPQGARS
jgi:hypothetical protein